MKDFQIYIKEQVN